MQDRIVWSGYLDSACPLSKLDGHVISHIIGFVNTVCYVNETVCRTLRSCALITHKVIAELDPNGLTLCAMHEESHMMSRHFVPLCVHLPIGSQFPLRFIVDMSTITFFVNQRLIVTDDNVWTCDFKHVSNRYTFYIPIMKPLYYETCIETTSDTCILTLDVAKLINYKATSVIQMMSAARILGERFLVFFGENLPLLFASKNSDSLFVLAPISEC